MYQLQRYLIGTRAKAQARLCVLQNSASFMFLNDRCRIRLFAEVVASSIVFGSVYRGVSLNRRGFICSVYGGGSSFSYGGLFCNRTIVF